MKRPTFLTLTLLLAASAAQAGCFADYKAKRDDPLRLHYGVAEITGDDCTKRAARAQLDPRLADAGWILLNVLDVFDDAGAEERKDSAGDFYLRF